MAELRPLTHGERLNARDPDAWTSAPWPPGEEDKPCRCGVHPVDCECDYCSGEYDDEPEQFDAHGIDCTCIYCLPGA
jgi:hypothetical protein